jgi:hypothetical protein
VVLEGEFDIIMPDDFTLPTEGSALEAFKNVLEEGIANAAGDTVTASMVEVVELDFESSRRALQMSAGLRFLTGGSLEVDFTITVPVLNEESESFGDDLSSDLVAAVASGGMLTAIQEADDSDADFIGAGASIDADSFEIEVENDSYAKKAKKFIAGLTLTEIAGIAGGLGGLGLIGIIASCVRMRQYQKMEKTENQGAKLSLHGLDDNVL